jgi:hypothetical protein
VQEPQVSPPGEGFGGRFGESLFDNDVIKNRSEMEGMSLQLILMSETEFMKHIACNFPYFRTYF